MAYHLYARCQDSFSVSKDNGAQGVDAFFPFNNICTQFKEIMIACWLSHTCCDQSVQNPAEIVRDPSDFWG